MDPIDRKSVNQFLYKHSDAFAQDDNYCWALVVSELVVEFSSSWMDSDTFEKCLSASGCPSGSEHGLITFVFPDGCSPMLEANARLLALCNQLILGGKRVIIDFSDNRSTLPYLDRLGFLEHLSSDIEMLPQRPKSSRANTYRGNSETLVEFGSIDSSGKNKALINKLTNRFKQNTFYCGSGEKRR